MLSLALRLSPEELDLLAYNGSSWASHRWGWAG